MMSHVNLEEEKCIKHTSLQVTLPFVAHFDVGKVSLLSTNHMPISLLQSSPNTLMSTSMSTLSLPEVTGSSLHSDSIKEWIKAVEIIEKIWISYRDRQMFKLLKHSVCAAEKSLITEILRKICPREANFFKDRSMKLCVRFRFGGSEFPPLIYFKIFNRTENGKGVTYLSGRKIIRPASIAAVDSLRLMGNRQFYDHMLQDILHHHQSSVVDEVDVTTLRDYMLYLANLDETPACLGGRENYWRKLTLEDLPRHTIFFDVVDFAYNHRLSSYLLSELSLLVTRPVTQEVQLRHIQAISQLKRGLMPSSPPLSGRCLFARQPKSSCRRSCRARARAEKLKRLYSKAFQDGGPHTADRPQPCHRDDNDGVSGIEEYGEGMETEANKLYAWIQALDISDESESPHFSTTWMSGGYG